MISFLGIAGTIIGFVMLSLFTALLDNLIFHTLTLKEIMLMSSVLCATDTVAAMSLIKVIIARYSPKNSLY
jgi:NhaP-type Na+/H+ or K+/H+ antiporter